MSSPKAFGEPSVRSHFLDQSSPGLAMAPNLSGKLSKYFVRVGAGRFRSAGDGQVFSSRYEFCIIRNSLTYLCTA